MKKSILHIPKLAAALLAVSLTVPAFAEERPSGWKTLFEEEGVLVSTRAEPGVDLPSMRGQTTLNADLFHVLAILLDDARSTEWAKGADETQVLRSIDPRTQLIYAHSRQPWPVKDRDLVMKRTVQVLKPGQSYRVHLVCMPSERAEVDNVIRVKNCETVFELNVVDGTHTRIDYRVQADPGGHIPTWMVRRASRSIPADTLRSLAKQIELTRGRYAKAVASWSRAI
ncbi:MAG TPA: START domain-containing protein [Polyangiales bacterium]|nr:START domain-containing protein [Polyangiales bacterium]